MYRLFLDDLSRCIPHTANRILNLPGGLLRLAIRRQLRGAHHFADRPFDLVRVTSCAPPAIRSLHGAGREYDLDFREDASIVARSEAEQHRWRETRNQGRPHPDGMGE